MLRRCVLRGPVSPDRHGQAVQDGGAAEPTWCPQTCHIHLDPDSLADHRLHEVDNGSVVGRAQYLLAITVHFASADAFVPHLDTTVLSLVDCMSWLHIVPFQQLARAINQEQVESVNIMLQATLHPHSSWNQCSTQHLQMRTWAASRIPEPTPAAM